jgi:hypothetical protein
MARVGKKTLEMRHVSFRMAPDVYNDFVGVAESRGVDLSALLNWVVTDYRPLLLIRRAEHDAAMLRAATMGLPQTQGGGPDLQDALNRVNAIIAQLQEVATKLTVQVNGRIRPAG